MFDSELSIRAVSPTTWALTAPLVWTGQQGDTFSVPAGFVTDFATSPRFLHWLVLPYGAYTRAAVLHDYLLTELARWSAGIMPATTTGGVTYQLQPPANSRDCDGIFRVAMRDLGVPWAKRWTMWAAVRAAACFNSRRAYGRQFAKDAPKVAGIALVTGPVILPGAIGVLISLGIVRIYTVLSGGAPPIRKSRRGRPAGTPEGKDHV
jgi:hypothetical protein